MRSSFLMTMSLAWLLLSGTAWSQEASTEEMLAKAIELYEDVQYSNALAKLDQVAAAPGLTDEVKAQIQMYRAFIHIILNQEPQAIKDFEALLEIQPHFELPPMTSPKFLEVYDGIKSKIRVRMEAKRAIKLAHEPPPSPFKGGELGLKASITGMKGDLVPRIQYRWGEEGKMLIAAMRLQAPGVYGIELSPPPNILPSQSLKLQYLIEVVDRLGHRIAQAGEDQSLFALEVQLEGAAPEEVSSPWYSKWWIWTILGVAVAGGVTAAVLAMPSNEPYGSLNITVNAP